MLKNIHKLLKTKIGNLRFIDNFLIPKTIQLIRISSEFVWFLSVKRYTAFQGLGSGGGVTRYSHTKFQK
jgi:hypothetical protein